MTNAWFGQDVLSVNQFNRPRNQYIFHVAHNMHAMVEQFGTADLLHGHVLANLFYGFSTRPVIICRGDDPARRAGHQHQ